MNSKQVKYLNGTREVSWIGTKSKADKAVAQGKEYLLSRSEWCEPALIHGNDEQILTHPVMQLAFDRILQKFHKSKDIALFSLCTATRPYSSSRKWSQYINLFHDKCDLIICSNGGIIPIEAEDCFPYLNYDAHGQKQYDQIYIKYGIERLKAFLVKANYRFCLFNFRHKMRNYHIAKEVGPWAKRQGIIEDYVILPTKDHYEKSQKEGFADAGYKIYPELWPTMLNPVIEQINKWNEICLTDQQKHSGMT